MSTRRELAVRISARVVRWASPACKEWAEGLEREVGFVEGDWAALTWALGSLRVVLDGRVSPAAARGGVPFRAPLAWALPLIQVSQILTNGVGALRASNWHDRIASGLIASGWMCWATFSVADKLWKRNEPPISDIHAYRQFLKAGLERRLERYLSLRRWFPFLAVLSICTGLVMNFEGCGEIGVIGTGIVVVGGAIAVWVLCLDTPAKIQTRLARVNDLIAESTDVREDHAGAPVSTRVVG